MRLFVAVNFDKKIRENFFTPYLDQLRMHTVSGNFTKLSNLHLTLAFIGETTREDAIRTVMDTITPGKKPFSIYFHTLGQFRRNDSSIVWVGGESKELLELQSQLAAALIKKNFPIEQRKFTPHVTLGRQVVFSDKLYSRGEQEKLLQSMNTPFSTAVDRISLMSSQRIQSELVYKEIYSAPLREG